MDKNKIATRLVMLFLESNEIPARLKKQKGGENKRKTKFKKDALIEQKFQASVKAWEQFMDRLFSKVPQEQAIRFVQLKPKVEQGLTSVTDCKDFQDFTAYFIGRRDEENCSNEELEQLALLFSAFQNEIETKSSFKIGSSNLVNSI